MGVLQAPQRGAWTLKPQGSLGETGWGSCGAGVPLFIKVWAFFYLFFSYTCGSRRRSKSCGVSPQQKAGPPAPVCRRRSRNRPGGTTSHGPAGPDGAAATQILYHTKVEIRETTLTKSVSEPPQPSHTSTGGPSPEDCNKCNQSHIKVHRTPFNVRNHHTHQEVVVTKDSSRSRKKWFSTELFVWCQMSKSAQIFR